MKMKARPDDTSVPEMSDWLETNDWIAELRDDGHDELADDAGAGPVGDGHGELADDHQAAAAGDRGAELAGDGDAEAARDGDAEAARDGDAEAARDGDAEAAGDGDAEAAGDGGAEPVGDGGPEPETAAPGANTLTPSAGISAHAEITERAAIGDQLRIPIAWCEMGSCISHHAHPAALGEADIRARAISVGWRVDALGRLACPECQQGGQVFWASHPVALWDRDAAITRVFLMTAIMRNERDADIPAGRRPT